MLQDAPSLPPAPDAVPAATVVILRDVPEGVEVLMLRRSSKLEFAGGMWVFPGGRVDPADALAGNAVDSVETARRAAVREAQEESGLCLSEDSLVPLSFWVPPAFNFKRFATWFFVAAAPEDADLAAADGSETTDHMWVQPKAAMELRDQASIELAPPTWVTLFQIAQVRNVNEMLERAAAATPRQFTTQFARYEDGRMASLWQGDAAYGLDDPDTPGPRHRLWMAEEGWHYEQRD